MSLENNFISGLDPTPLPVIDASQLLQMVQQAQPENNRGLIYFGITSPDIVNNPWLVRFIWLDTTSFPATVKLFNQNTATWQAIALAPLSVVTGMIADGAITPAKIAPGLAYQLLRTDPTGLATEWWSLQFAANSIGIVTLVKSTTPGDFLRTTLDGSSIEWFTFNIGDYLGTASLSPNVLQNSGIPGDVLFVQDSAGNLSWTDVISLIADNSFPISKLVSGSANTFLKTDAGGNRVWATIPSTIPVHGRNILTVGAGNYTVPAGVYALDVEVIGGGGGGRNVISGSNVGGSGGGYCRALLSVTPGQVIPYVVGAGGLLGNPGQDGGDSSFNTTIIANKGLKGSATLTLGGLYSGGDYGSKGGNGGSTYPNPAEVTSGVPTFDNMAFCGGASGYPLSKGGGIAIIPTLGGGGPSASPSGVGTTACSAQNGADGLIIITY